ncbi:MAG: hypothetical protein B7C24_00395 [Bacteroidetes bacterium 4572_77]|nr:MAG: hypothetical protein B7C24_00395 [Bacteroidetes bacterium 4572_77]
MKKNLFLIGSILVLLFSCAKEESENVNQDSIYSIYELFYDIDADITTARATFRFGGPTGTLLDLSPPAVVTFNGDKLLYNSVFGFHKKEYTGFINSGEFVYTDLDNKTFTNNTPTTNTAAFPLIDTISAESAFTFIWIGDPLAADETIALTINGTQQSNFEIFSSSTEGATELILPANKLQNLGVGDADWTLSRSYEKFTIDEGTSTGGRMAIWYSTTGSVYIDN